ncbi:MAG: MMPL family transporter [Myxococcota bacterium]
MRFLVHALERLLAISTCRPRSTLAGCVAVAVVSVAWTAQTLVIEADRNALVREGRDWNERFQQYRNNFGGTQDLLVVLSGSTSETRESYADRLAEALVRSPAIASVFYRVDPNAFKERSLLYLDPPELERIRTRLEDDAPAIQRLFDDPGLESTLRLVDQAMSDALVGELVSGLFEVDPPTEPKKQPNEATEPEDLGLLIAVLEGIDSHLDLSSEPPPFESPWGQLLGGGASRSRSGYVTSSDGTYTFVIVAPKRSAASGVRADREAIDAIESVQKSLAADFPDTKAGITGQRAINAAEIRATVRDTRTASLIALAGIVVLFVLAFRRVRHPVYAVAALLIGIGWAAGAMTLTVGRLTVLSVAFTSVLIGLGIDFGIHIVARYEEQRGSGVERREALRQAVLRSGSGNIAGAMTTSLAFFGLLLGEFRGLAELGVIAGAGVLLCLLSSFLVIPALMTLAPGTDDHRGRRDARPVANTSSGPAPRVLLIGASALCIVGLLLSPRVSFDSNLLRLQAEGVPAVDLELELLRNDAQSGSFAVSVVDTIEEARTVSAALRALPEVASTRSLAQLVPPDQEERVQAALRLAPAIGSFQVSPQPAQPLELSRVLRRIDKLRYKLRPEAADSARLKPKQLRRTRELLASTRQRLTELDPTNTGPARARLMDYQTRMVRDLYEQIDWLKAGVDPKPFAQEDLPASVRERFVGADGRQLVRIYPRDNIWEPKTRQTFIDSIRRVDPNATGVPVQMHESSRLMFNGYLEGGVYALCIVLLVLLIDFRSVTHALLAFVPLVVGSIWTLGVMAMFDIDFNLANLVIVPLMIGIGIDIGVHMVHRYVQDGVGGRALVAGSTGRAVIVSGLTTALGFGTLAIAQHRGIQSLGLLLGIGVLATVVAALAVLAPLLEIRTRRKTQARYSAARSN